MASVTTNWIHEKAATERDSDNKALSKARKIEDGLKKMGWKWFRISDRLEILIPFGKDGKPTALGLQKIERQKKLHGID